MVNSQDFAKRLHLVLDYYQLSATSLADKLEVNRSTISHLLSGRNKPSLDVVMKLLSHFPEIDLYWLMNGTGEFPKQKSELASADQSEKVSSLSSEMLEMIPRPPKEDSTSGAEIDRIVIFFKDGSFKAYNGE